MSYNLMQVAIYNLTFIFKPEGKICDVAFENIFNVLKKLKLKMQEDNLFYQLVEPVDVNESSQ